MGRSDAGDRGVNLRAVLYLAFLILGREKNRGARKNDYIKNRHKIPFRYRESRVTTVAPAKKRGAFRTLVLPLQFVFVFA